MKKRRLSALVSLIVAVFLAVFLSGCSLSDFFNFGNLGQADNSFPYDFAVEDGFTGTRGEWLASQETPSTVNRRMYEEAIADGSFEGSYYEFLQSLDGVYRSLYNEVIADGSFAGSYFEFLQALALKGDDTPYINSALRSVVSIFCYFQGTNVMSAGSGVVWSVNKTTGDMYIVTNYHVLYNSDAPKQPFAKEIYVRLYGAEVNARTMYAKYVDGTMNYDIAVLFVDGNTVVGEAGTSNTHTNAQVVKESSVVAATVGDSDSLRVSERVYAIGNPLGDGISVVSGDVTSAREYIPIQTADGKKTVEILEVCSDAPINHGNSGGGLFNSTGELVGLVNARLEGQRDATVGYAIHLSVVEPFVRNILAENGVAYTAGLDTEDETGTGGTRQAAQSAPYTIYRSMYEETVADGSFEGSYYEFLQSLDSVYRKMYDAVVIEGFGGTYFEFMRELGIKGDDAPYVDSALRSVVRIQCSYQGTNVLSAGAGVVWSVDEAAGDMYIVTNYHVLYSGNSTTGQFAKEISVWLYGGEVAERTMSAQYVGGTMDYDIAVLFIDGDTVVHEGGSHTNAQVVKESAVIPVTIGDADSVCVSERVYAIGNPLGGGISVVDGVISVAAEYLQMSDDGSVNVLELRTDAPIEHGNSGGGLFNAAGELIGIVNARLEGDGVIAFGYAIHMGFVEPLVRNILDHEDGYAYVAKLGLITKTGDSVSVFDGVTGKAYIEEKVVVDRVSLISAANSAGIKTGDTIVSARVERASGTSVTVAITRKHILENLLLELRKGDTLVLTVSRGGKLKECEMKFTSAADFTKYV